MKKISFILFGLTLFITLSFPVIAFSEDLTDTDVAHLIFMRSEEKLARDVYLAIDKMYPKIRIFYRIATRAEQTHTDKILEKLEKFNIPDPEPSTKYDTLPPADQIGVFENPWFKEYFEDKFKKLTDLADNGLLDALYVGALIEELDMKDIHLCNEVFYKYYPNDLLPEDPEDCGGLSMTEVPGIEKTLDSLLEGSENHLCAFLSQIIRKMEDDCYMAQYLTPEEVREIVQTECPDLLDSICETP